MMKLRLFAFAAAATAAAALASPASGQALGQAHANGYIGMGLAPHADTGLSSCRARAFQCGVTAYNFYGVRQGLAWFQYGAQRGSVPSMRSIGLILLRGEANAPADPAAAMGWFYEAALRGDRLSMQALADGFEQGVGVERDPALASYWRDRAANAHDAQAPRFLRPTH
jgi:TPR repeat protein